MAQGAFLLQKESAMPVYPKTVIKTLQQKMSTKQLMTHDGFVT